MYKKTNQKGFSIIEVLIVLAIAGLIMLVVFLAVPALQRNARNNARTADASLIASAINECLNNKNGKRDSCDSFPAASNGYDELTDFIDISTLKQLDQTPTSITTTGTAIGTDGNEFASNKVAIKFGVKCNSTGDGVDAANSRDYAIIYSIEGQGTTKITKCQG